MARAGPTRPRTMDGIDLRVNHLLLVAGIMLGLVVHELVLSWTRRLTDSFHLWAAAWSATAGLFVFGHYVQRAAGGPQGAIDGTLLILSSAVALMPLSVGIARSSTPAALSARALWLSTAGAALLIALITLTDLAVPGVFERTDALGVRYWDNRPGWLHQTALGFIGAWSIYIVVRLRRARELSSSPRSRMARIVAFFLLPVIANDILHGAGLIDSVELIGYAFAAVAMAISYSMTRRYESSLEGSRALIHAAPDAILVHRNGRLTFVNPAALAFLGYESESDLVGRSIDIIVPEESRASAAERYIVADRLTVATAPQIEPFVRRNGDIARGEVVRMGVVFDGVASGVTMARDVSEREEVQRQLRLADRMVSVGTLAAGVAHEINNPLSYVITNLDQVSWLLQSRQGGDLEELSELVEEARDGAARVRQVVRDISVFSRSDEETIEVVDVRGAVETALSLTQNEIRHRAKLVRRFDGDCYVRANPARLGQVFVNLVVNAAHAIGDGAADGNRIVVSTRRRDGLVVVEIEDTGCGLPEDNRERLFDPFFTTKPIGQGTGLGLSVCHGIVSALGGTIELFPRERGGACARVTLRASEVPELRKVASERPSRGSARPGARVLVVDDEPTVGRALKRVLSDHQVTVVSTGEQAIARFEAERFDLLICDIMMPGLTGIDVYERLKAHLPGFDRRIMFMTGGAFTPRARRFLRGANVTVIEKPFEPASVRRVVSERLRPLLEAGADSDSRRARSSAPSGA